MDAACQYASPANGSRLIRNMPIREPLQDASTGDVGKSTGDVGMSIILGVDLPLGVDLILGIDLILGVDIIVGVDMPHRHASF